jgi:hypothetical protein
MLRSTSIRLTGAEVTDDALSKVNRLRRAVRSMIHFFDAISLDPGQPDWRTTGGF